MSRKKPLLSPDAFGKKPPKRKGPRKKRVLKRGVARVNSSILTGLLSNVDQPLEWRKIIAWLEEIGWEHARPLFLIHLSGYEGIPDYHLNTLMGSYYDPATLLQHDLITRIPDPEHATFISNIEKTAPPDSLVIKDSATAEVHKSILAEAEERARFLAEKTSLETPSHAHAGSIIRARTRGALKATESINTESIREEREERSSPIDSINSRQNLWPENSRSIQPRKKKRKKKKHGAVPHGSDSPNPRSVFGEPVDSQKRETRGRKGYKDTPSLYPRLNEWRMKKNPNRWKALDWVGYWLYCWRKCYHEEDPLFVGSKLHRSIKDAKKGKRLDDPYYETGYKIIALRDNDRGFCGNGEQLKNYIAWLLSDFVDEATWMDDSITHRQAFRRSNNWFLDKFKTRSVKKPKKKPKWHHWGYAE